MTWQPFPLLDVMPTVLRGVVLDFVWDRERLWKLELPVEAVPRAGLDWHLRLPLWAFEGTPFAVTPLQVAEDPNRFHLQYARTMAADLGFPVHVLESAGKVTVLDGVHRLLQAHLAGQQTLLVKRLPIEHVDQIARPAGGPATALGAVRGRGLGPGQG